MKLREMRRRMLVAAVLPVLLVVSFVVGAFSFSRVGELGEAHAQRAKLLLRQVSMASEFGLFSGNRASLQSAASAVKLEADVKSVRVYDVDAQLLVSAGAFTPLDAAQLRQTEFGVVVRKADRDVVAEPIYAVNIQLDDMFADRREPKVSTPKLLGYAVLEVSRSALAARERNVLLVSLAVGVIGVFLGGFFAARLGERVVQPILNVSRRIERIGQGDFSGRANVRAHDPLQELQDGLNQMAMRLTWGRDELEQRIVSATQELRQKKEEAELATQAKSKFLAAASHDLRQPTHALGMFIARLRQIELPADASQLVGRLEASVQAMQDFLDGLLDLSRLDAGVVQVQMRPLSVSELFTSVRTSLGQVAVDKGLYLRIRPCSVWVHSDPVLLQRMVMNLVHNALRYTERGTVLLCGRLVEQGRSLRIDVLDSGIGIAQTDHTRVFQEFVQLGNADREHSNGQGLGLNIVERTAALLGIGIALRSSLGCGTRFSLTVPLVVAPDVVSSSAGLPALVSLAGVKVLVVEDDILSLEAMRDLLDSWGCEVLAAASSAQATELLLRGHRVDLVVSDYRLGDDVDGLRLIAGLRALAGREIPACLMSGDTDAALMEKAKDAGLTLLHKPVRPAKLRSLMRHLLPVSQSAH
ncbi:hybrid sensor histidine kinase/response regulator [Rhodoferax aquaticus]|uniref:histidine kinase n=1 Tax=Rhodoferax aquaticus TaxID=2527691 RepID=A0A515EQC6_9BURK|nr:ATP-binding protein [Rhodoferax aquaticus]QDL54862.1 response regulator [Rhodoferax aquaticus]